MATNNSSKQLLMIFADSDAEANRARVFELFCQIAIAHSVELGWNHFCLDDIKIYEDGSIMFARKPVCNLSDALRRANYKDFAGLVLCLATGRHRAGRNLIRAGRKVKDPVLREIILTLGGQDEPGLER